MTEQRIAQIVMSQQYDNPTLAWKQTGYAELETAMNSPVWKLDPKRLLQLANGKSDANTREEPPAAPTPQETTTATPTETEETDKPFFSGKRFLPIGMRNYFETQGLHTLSLKHEDFIRVYQNGIYAEEQGEILERMATELGEQGFKMSYFNEVMDYYQKRTTPKDECQQNGYINVQNGFLNIAKLELEDHSPDRKSLIQLPVTFDAAANCPKIDAWLKDCLDGDTEQETLFYEAIGYTLLQTTELQKMFFLLGPTQTGKSTAIHIIKGLLGKENCSDIELAPIEDEANRFSRAQLYGKLANFASDISPRYLTGDGNVKKIIAGDGITGENKFRPPFSFEPDCTLWAAANSLPGSGDKSGAWYEKMAILRFEKQFLSTGDNKPDRSLKHTLTHPSELSGLLNVALICGTEALKRGHFTKSRRNDEVIEEYKILNDHVLQFINSLGELNIWDDDPFFTEIYKDWCDAQGIKPLSKALLANATKRHGIHRKRKKEGDTRFFVWERTQKA